MKKTILTTAMLFIAITTSAQFYISASGGYSFGAGEKVLGKEVDASGASKEIKGSYGEGTHIQLRTGYLFSEKIGMELGLGYLHGAEKQVNKFAVPFVDVKARGRAYGAALSGVYNVTNNFYVRAGVLTKIGGKTEVVGKVKTKLPVSIFNPAVPATVLADLDVEFTNDFKGKMPFGFTGAVGYKFPVADNLALFAEVDYMGINVTRDTSKLSSFSATLAGNKVTRDQLVAGVKKLPAQNQAVFAPLLPLLQDEAKWGEGSLPSAQAPYSSIGINFGITYTFK